MKGNYQLLREHVARKSFKPRGCERLVKEVTFGLRSWVKMVISGEEGKGGFEDVKDSQGHSSTEREEKLSLGESRQQLYLAGPWRVLYSSHQRWMKGKASQ